MLGAALIALGVGTVAAQATELELMHFWTSGGEGGRHGRHQKGGAGGRH